MDSWLGIEIDDTELIFLIQIIQELIVPCARENRIPSNSDIMHKVLKLAMEKYREGQR